MRTTTGKGVLCDSETCKMVMFMNYLSWLDGRLASRKHHTDFVIVGVCDVNLPGYINCDSIGTTQLSVDSHTTITTASIYPRACKGGDDTSAIYHSDLVIVIF